MQDQNLEDTSKQHYSAAERQGAVQGLKAEIAIMEKQIEKGKAFLRLEKDKDFKFIIEEGYCKDMALNAVRGLGTKPSEAVEKDLNNVLKSIGILEAHFEGIMQLAANAELQLPLKKQELGRIQNLN